MARVIIWAVIALVVGLIGGAALALAVGGAPTAPLDCTVNSDNTITTCVNEQGNEVDVPTRFTSPTSDHGKRSAGNR